MWKNNWDLETCRKSWKKNFLRLPFFSSSSRFRSTSMDKSGSGKKGKERKISMIRPVFLNCNLKRLAQHSTYCRWQSSQVGDHSSITSAKRWVGGIKKMTIFADLQYHLCWRRWVGGPKKQKTCWGKTWMVPIAFFWLIISLLPFFLYFAYT